MRAFLDIRYTFPGYTSILFFLAFIFPHLNSFLEGVHGITSSFTLGIIPLVSGAPIGFLISQIWYFFSILNIGGLGVYGRQGDNKRHYIKFLHDNGVVEKRYETVEVLDYLHHLAIAKSDTLRDFVRRRWSMYNIMGSTISAIIWGLFFSYLFRAHLSPFSSELMLAHEKIVLISGFVLCVLFGVGMWKVRKDHEYMVWVIIRNQIREDIFWKKKFPSTFFAFA
jgi:hypothetical protein